jgi:hypothetical protein
VKLKSKPFDFLLKKRPQRTNIFLIKPPKLNSFLESKKLKNPKFSSSLKWEFLINWNHPIFSISDFLNTQNHQILQKAKNCTTLVNTMVG